MLRWARTLIVFGLGWFCMVTMAVAATEEGAGFEQHLRVGQALFAQGRNDAAVKEFKAAVALQPGNSMAHLWLGRALGRKTEAANPLGAALEVGEVRREFERAVALDPDNLEARSDLLEFYLDAPRSFGGGIDKAQAQADAIARLDPAQGQQAREQIQDKAQHHARSE